MHKSRPNFKLMQTLFVQYVNVVLAQYPITVEHGGRHFDKGMVSAEMFVWLYLIDRAMVDHFDKGKWSAVHVMFLLWKIRWDESADSTRTNEPFITTDSRAVAFEFKSLRSLFDFEAPS